MRPISEMGLEELKLAKQEIQARERFIDNAAKVTISVPSEVIQESGIDYEEDIRTFYSNDTAPDGREILTPQQRIRYIVKLSDAKRLGWA